jgi:hypothetical protein
LLEICGTIIIVARKSLTQKKNETKTSVVKLNQVFPSCRFDSHFWYSSGVSISFKGLASKCLNSVESVYDVGLYMGVLGGPKESLNVSTSSTPNSFEESTTSFNIGECGLTC